MKNLAFHAYSDERWFYYQLSLLHLIHFSLKGWENVLFELGSYRVTVPSFSPDAAFLWRCLGPSWASRRSSVVPSPPPPPWAPHSGTPGWRWRSGNHCKLASCASEGNLGGIRFLRTWPQSTKALGKGITVNSPLTDTLVSGQLYLRTLFSIPVLTSQPNSVFTHSRKRTLS